MKQHVVRTACLIVGGLLVGSTLVVGAAPALAAETFHVDNTGCGGGTGGSGTEADPYCTIGEAIADADGNGMSGDKIIVHGTEEAYNESNTIADEGLTIEGSKKPAVTEDGDPVFTIDADDVTIEGMLIDARENVDGIRVNEDRTGAVIEKNHIVDADGDGIQLDPNSEATVRGNRIDNSSDSGIEVYGGVDATISGNEIRQSDGNGIFLAFGVDDVKITGNAILGTTDYDDEADGILVSDLEEPFGAEGEVGSDDPNGDIKILGNVIRAAAGDCIDIEWHGSAITVAANHLVDCGDDGIETDEVGTKIEFNLIRNVEDEGVALDSYDDTEDSPVKVFANVIVRPNEDGIDVDSSDIDATEIRNNYIFGATVDGIMDDGSDTKIVGNVIIRSGDDGLYLGGTDAVVRLNRIFGSVETDIDDSGTGSSFFGNICFSSDPDGRCGLTG